MKDVQQSFEITAGMMVEQINRQGGKRVAVTVGNFDTAFTDGTNIAIPSFPPEKRFIGLAYLGHEASHCRVTDMDKFVAFAMRGPVHKTVLNIVEDIRIERSITRTYPGLNAQLQKLVAHLVETKKFKAPQGSYGHPVDVLVMWLLYSRRAWVLRQTALADYATKADKRARKVFGDAFIDKMEAELACLKTMDITPKGMDESVKLAETIIGLLKQEAESQAQQQGQQGDQTGQDDSNGQSGDSADQGSDGSESDRNDSGSSAAGSTNSDEGDESQGSQGGGQGDQSDSDEDADGADGGGSQGSQDGDQSGDSGSGSESGEASDGASGAGGDSSEEDSSDASSADSAGNSADDYADPVDDSAGSAAEKAGSKGRGGNSAIPTDWDSHAPRQKTDLGELAASLARKERDRTPMPETLSPRVLDEEESKLLATMDYRIEMAAEMGSEAERLEMERQKKWIADTAKTLAGPMRREMRSLLEGEDRVRHDPRRSGRLNRRALPGVMTGERRVFHRKVEGKTQRSAIHIMLDASGSMRREIVPALAAVHSILEAVEPLPKVNSGFSVFPAELVEEDGFGGYEHTACTSVAKQHGESLVVAKKRRDYFPSARGGTPMVSSMMGVVPTLLSQPEERKLLIVVTDGAPNEGYQLAAQKIDEYRRLGVEVIGIGLGAPKTRLSFGREHTINIEDVFELPRALKKVVRSAIV